LRPQCSNIISHKKATIPRNKLPKIPAAGAVYPPAAALPAALVADAEALLAAEDADEARLLAALDADEANEKAPEVALLTTLPSAELALARMLLIRLEMLL